MTSSTAKPVAVCADDIALCCFRKDLLAALQGCSARAEVEPLLSRIPVIEVHLVASEAATTIGAGDLTKLSEEGRSRVLPTPDPFNLAFAVRGVVPNVGWSLIALRKHD